MFGLSTSWNAARFTQGKDLIFEIKAIGFETVELSFNLTGDMVREIAELAVRGQIKVLSLHNFCPIPETFKREEALPDSYSLASLDEQERSEALRYTKRSIDTAKRVGAKAVVLHCGRVEIKDYTRDLIALYEAGRVRSPHFIELKERAIVERQQEAAPFFNKALKSIEELNVYAGSLSIALGIENRFYYREIPSFKEIGIILKEFKGSNIFYWHDTGHAEIMDNLGFAKHRGHLEGYAQSMLGIHLHNVKGCLDHQPPSRGDFDFKQLKPYLRQDTIKIIEAHSPASAEDLVLSKKYLEEIFNG